MKLYTLNKVIEELSLAYPNVREYHYGDVYEAMNRSRDIEYASMVLTHQTTDVIDDYTRNHTFNLFYIDRLLQDESNKLEIQSQGQEVLEGILANLENVGIEVLDDRHYINFTQKFADLCAGCYVTFIAQVPIEDCDGDEIRIVNTVDGRSGDVYLSDLYASKDYVLDAIESAITSGVDLDNYYTKDETDARISEQGDSHIDKLEVGQIDMTTHSSAGTCNINGVNKITASSGDIASLSSNTVNAASVNVQYMGSSKNVASWISQKLDASAYTPTDLSQYWTSAQTQSAITQAISGKADASVVSALTEEVAANSYNIGELQDAMGDMALDSEVVHKGLTETITGNKTFSSDTTFNGAVTLLGEEAVIIGNDSLEDILQEKLDVTAYTPTDLSEYWTSAQTQSAITSATTNMQTTTNMTQSITSGSTATQYPSASAVYGVIPKFQVNNGVLNIIVP